MTPRGAADLDAVSRGARRAPIRRRPWCARGARAARGRSSALGRESRSGSSRPGRRGPPWCAAARRLRGSADGSWCSPRVTRPRGLDRAGRRLRRAPGARRFERARRPAGARVLPRVRRREDVDPVPRLGRHLLASSRFRARVLSLDAKRRAVARARARRAPRSPSSTVCARRCRPSRAGGSAARRGRAWSRSFSPTCRATAPSLVGSGPTVRGRRGDSSRVVGIERDGLDAAARRARRLGVRVERPADGASRARRAEAGARLARRAAALPPGSVLLAGGETTVASRPAARGAEAAASSSRSARPRELAGTDRRRLARRGLGRPRRQLRRRRRVRRRRRRWLGRGARASIRPGRSPAHDTRAVLRGASGTSSSPGPTGTNVGDWVFLLRLEAPAVRARPGPL